ncbi:MAG: hypothetical protein ABTQ29_12390 [Siculibacillus sp.]
MKILIATPAYRDQVMRGYHETVCELITLFAARFPFVEFEQKIIDVPLLTTARNILASIVLDDPSFTHLLFIDADMAFSPMLVARMLAFRKPVIGAFYPEKKVHWARLAAAMTPERTTVQARLIASSYVCGGNEISEIRSSGQVVTRVVDGFVRAHACGAGAMLIERQVFERLREVHPELWVEAPGEQIRAWGLERGGLLQCFDGRLNEQGYHVSEDVAFCLRWTDVGGEIWAAVDEAIVHSGSTRFQGHALIHLKGEKGLRMRDVRRRSRGASDRWYVRALAAPAEPKSRR